MQQTAYIGLVVLALVAGYFLFFGWSDGQSVSAESARGSANSANIAIKAMYGVIASVAVVFLVYFRFFRRSKAHLAILQVAREEAKKAEQPEDEELAAELAEEKSKFGILAQTRVKAMLERHSPETVEKTLWQEIRREKDPERKRWLKYNLYQLYWNKDEAQLRVQESKR